jgi:hypothetical protein
MDPQQSPGSDPAEVRRDTAKRRVAALTTAAGLAGATGALGLAALLAGQASAQGSASDSEDQSTVFEQDGTGGLPGDRSSGDGSSGDGSTTDGSTNDRSGRGSWPGPLSSGSDAPHATSGAS